MTTTTAKQFGVWDTEFNDWDSGPFTTVADATLATYPGLPKGADTSKYKQSKRLVVREWMQRGEVGEMV